MKITFLIGDTYKILDFELEDYKKVSNLNIYSSRAAEAALRDAECELTAGSLLNLFKYYMGGDGTLEEYIDHIVEHGFFTPYMCNLRIKIEQ